MEKRRFFSVKAASKFSSLSERFLYKLCQNREIRYYKVGNRIVIGREDLEQLVTKNEVQTVDDWGEKLGLVK